MARSGVDLVWISKPRRSSPIGNTAACTASCSRTGRCPVVQDGDEEGILRLDGLPKPRVAVVKAETKPASRPSRSLHKDVINHLQTWEHLTVFTKCVTSKLVRKYITLEGQLILVKQLAKIDREQGLTARGVREHVNKWVEAMIKREDAAIQRQIDRVEAYLKSLESDD